VHGREIPTTPHNPEPTTNCQPSHHTHHLQRHPCSSAEGSCNVSFKGLRSRIPIVSAWLVMRQRQELHRFLQVRPISRNVEEHRCERAAQPLSKNNLSVASQRTIRGNIRLLSARRLWKRAMSTPYLRVMFWTSTRSTESVYATRPKPPPH